MAGNIKEPSEKKNKRSRHWKENETRILVSKWPKKIFRSD